MSHPSPVLFFDTINAYQRTEALKAAIELDVFSQIALGANTADALAKKIGAAERGVRILCDFLTVNGFLTKSDSVYQLTPDSATFLDKASPAYLGCAVDFLAAPTLRDCFDNLAGAVRKGGTIKETGTLEPEHPLWVKFARGMAPIMRLPAQMLPPLVKRGAQDKLKILDIAAGHGVFGIAMLKHFVNAEVTALDWPNVLQVAKENAEAAGVASRHHLLPGSAFEVAYGNDYDLILLTNILHHFDVAGCEALAKRVHAALKPGGIALTLEFVPNEDRVTPGGTAAFSLTMLGTTPAGDAYTFAEYEKMFRNAGFARSELHSLLPTMQQVVSSTRA